LEDNIVKMMIIHKATYTGILLSGRALAHMYKTLVSISSTEKKSSWRVLFCFVVDFGCFFFRIHPKIYMDSQENPK
jgi:hypothetical protein